MRQELKILIDRWRKESDYHCNARPAVSEVYAWCAAQLDAVLDVSESPAMRVKRLRQELREANVDAMVDAECMGSIMQSYAELRAELVESIGEQAVVNIEEKINTPIDTRR